MFKDINKDEVLKEMILNRIEHLRWDNYGKKIVASDYDMNLAVNVLEKLVKEYGLQERLDELNRLPTTEEAYEMEANDLYKIVSQNIAWRIEELQKQLEGKA